MTNTRVALHIIGAVAAALTGGAVVFEGLSPVVAHDFVAVAALIGIVTNAWLAATSTGVSLPFRPSPDKDSAKRAVERGAKRWLGR